MPIAEETTTPLLEFRQQLGFAEYSLPPEFAWQDDEDDIHWMHRLGYVDQQWVMGDESGEDHITAHRRNDDAGTEVPLFLVVLSDYSSGEFVFVHDAPSLLALRIQLAPMLGVVIVDRLVAVHEIAAKHFRAEHGHDPLGSCEACDPEEMKRRRLAARARKTRPHADPSGGKGTD